MQNIIAIALAGMLGTLARYGLSGLTQNMAGAGFAWGTLAVNLAGCVLLGVIMQLTVATDLVPPQWRLPLAVGFCGAFTTYSTFAYETIRFLEDGAYLLALGNISANLVLGLVCIWLGFTCARLIAGGV